MYTADLVDAAHYELAKLRDELRELAIQNGLICVSKSRRIAAARQRRILTPVAK